MDILGDEEVKINVTLGKGRREVDGWILGPQDVTQPLAATKCNGA
jgi:hypothetical protein